MFCFDALNQIHACIKYIAESKIDFDVLTSNPFVS